MNEATPTALYRILDASANRAAEGLRTMEEYARFVLDDAALSGSLKKARHDLASALGRLPRGELLAARDTPGDVGTQLTEPTEQARHGMADVIAAAASRTAQSLRVIEEYGKTIDAVFASQVERVRYECYASAASLELAAMGRGLREQVAAAKLYVLIDAGSDADSFADSVESLCRAGVDVIQLRDRRADRPPLDDRTLIDRAGAGTIIARRHGVLFIVNDRADLALAADADGVHVGQEELPTDVARRIVGSGRLIGVSTHSIDQARRAVADGADYIGCGPVFAGRTKQFDEYVGPPFLRQVAAEITLPAFAIGGIDLDNVAEVVQSGIHRIAVTGVIRDTKNQAEVVKTLKASLV